MIIGVPRERKNHEYRVGILPDGVKTLVENGHTVLVESLAGDGIAITNGEYARVGAKIIQNPEIIYQESELIVKVKEPLPGETCWLHAGQILFAFLHLAAAPELAEALLEKKVTAIAYETVQLDNGILPILSPMSEIAGKLSVQVGAHYLEKVNGGSGVLLGGVPGVKQASVTVIGGGRVGLNAAKIALGMGASVTVIDINPERLRYLSDILNGKITLLISNSQNIASSVVDSDLVIGALLTPGAKAKKVVTREMVSRMRSGSVVVDVAIDQGGCFETSVPTNFDKPVYRVNGVIHYCVTNLPGAVPKTSTVALTSATLPYILEIASLGFEKAVASDEALKRGLNTFQGKVVHRAVAEALDIGFSPYPDT